MPSLQVRTARLAAGAVLGLTAVAAASPAAAATGPASNQTQIDATRAAEQLRAYGGDPEREGQLVSDEDTRLLSVRTVASLARWDKTKLVTPYRLSTGSTYTLVLTPREAPYAVSDLLQLAPQTFVRQVDGSYLLLENLAVQPGATLALSNPGGLTLRMSSSPRGFVSIVSLGGALDFEGSAQHPLTVTSWDEKVGQLDDATSDGRAYIRAEGGQFTMRFAKVSHLGFWSGRTGGVALTGTDRPNTGQLDAMGKKVTTNPAKDRTVAAGAAASSASSALPRTPGRSSATVSAAGALVTPTIGVDAPPVSYVSATIANTTIDRDAFGLFVASARGVQIADSTVSNSLVDGIVLHRFVTSSTVERTVSRDNGGAGFVINRAATGLLIDESTAEGNAGNGFSLSGRSLADGPSAMGSPLGSYGNNTLTNSVAKGNAHDGIEVVGGTNIALQGNSVSGGDMGIVVRDGAQSVRVTGNEVTGRPRQGISLRDGVQATVTGNVIAGGETGVYVRASKVELARNTLTKVQGHGISVVGSSGGTVLDSNLVSGKGLSAIDVKRASGRVSVTSNNTAQWKDTSPFLVKLKRWARPMTLIWILVLTVVGLSAFRGRRHQGRRGLHPYHRQMPLEQVLVLPEGGSSQTEGALVGSGSAA